MTNLFEGTPVKASVAPNASATYSPQWLQNAIYNQVQLAQNVAAMPYQQYGGQLVAGTSPYQQAAWQQVANSQNAWQQPYNAAMSGFQNLASGPGSYDVMQPYLGQQSGMLGGIDYQAGVNAASPYFSQQAGALGGINYNQGVNAAQPYLSSAMNSGGGLGVASPWLNQSGQGSAGRIDEFMNPYISGVTDQIAKLGQRNLTENLLPGISDSFVKAGQFGGTRMGEFGSRALRDTQEAILGQQANALQSGFNTALGAAQGEQQRLLGIGSAFGNLGSQNQSNILQGAQLAGTLGNQAVQNRLSGASQYGDMASQMGALQNAAINAKLSGASQYGQMGQNAANAKQSDLAQFGNLYSNMMAGAGQGQDYALKGAAALEQAGSAQQQQKQNELNAQYQMYQQQQNYPKEQTAWMNAQLAQLGGLAPQYTQGYGPTANQGANPSVASQLGGLASVGAGLYDIFSKKRGGHIKTKGYALGGSVDGGDEETFEEFMSRVNGAPAQLAPEDDYGIGLPPQNVQTQPIEGHQPLGAPQQLQVVPQPAMPTTGPVAPALGGNSELAQLYQLYQQPSQYDAEIAAAREKSDAAQRQFEEALMKSVETGDSGPSRAELYFQLASSLLAPGKTGNFTEGLGRAGEVLAGHQGETRKAKQLTADRKRQALAKIQEYRAGAAKDELDTLRGFRAEEGKDQRAVLQAAIKDYMESGKPQSEAGKIAKDEGKIPGTPEYAARVGEIVKDKLESGDFYRQAMLGISAANLQLNQARGRREDEKLQRLTPKELDMKLDTEELVANSQSALDALNKAIGLNDTAFGGTMLERGQYRLLSETKPEDPRVVATSDFENLVGAQGLAQLKAIFGAAPTEGERKILMELQGISSKSKTARKEILQRARAAADSRLARNKKRLDAINSGKYRIVDDTAPEGAE